MAETFSTSCVVCSPGKEGVQRLWYLVNASSSPFLWRGLLAWPAAGFWGEVRASSPSARLRMARNLRTLVECPCFGGMRLDPGVLGAHPAQPLWAADTRVLGTTGDRKACQKTCTAWGTNAARLHSDPEPANSEAPGACFRRRGAGVGVSAGCCEVPHRQGQKGEKTPTWRELAAEWLCMSQAACKGKCKFSNRFFQSCAALLKSFYWPCAQRNQSTPSLIWALYNQNQYFFSWL